VEGVQSRISNHHLAQIATALFIEGRMKALVSKALPAYHYSGYPLTSFLHSFVHSTAAINVLTTQVRRGDEGDRYTTPFERKYGKLPHATDLPVPIHLEPRYIYIPYGGRAQQA
jgi:hypothetical protein